MTAGVTPVTRELKVSPVTGTIGAELSGVDLAGELSDETVAEIRAALLANRVVFFRDQALDYERQVAFGRRLGTLTLGHPTIQSPPDQPLMEEVDSAKGAPAADWHTDVTFLDQPVSFTCLRGVVIPEVGGDTMWANTVNAYATLTPELRGVGRQFAGRFTPTRPATCASTVAARILRGSRAASSSCRRSTGPSIPRSWCIPRPANARCCSAASRIASVGYPIDLSRAIIRTFQEYVTRPENTVRWHWRVGDVAIWDNRSTQHCAVVDYGDAYRRCERVTVAGSTPIGVDGRPSVALKGDARTFYAGHLSRDLGDRRLREHLARDLAQPALQVVDEREPGSSRPVGTGAKSS